jgi:hypothetical protein
MRQFIFSGVCKNEFIEMGSAHKDPKLKSQLNALQRAGSSLKKNWRFAFCLSPESDAPNTGH